MIFHLVSTSWISPISLKDNMFSIPKAFLLFAAQRNPSRIGLNQGFQEHDSSQIDP